MHPIEQKIQVFLENLDKADASQLEPFIEEFGENCKKAIRESLLSKRSEEPFRLRMSNIGKPLRQLMQEKEYGAVEFDPQQKLRGVYGYMWESFLFFLLQASGINLETNKKVSLEIDVGDNQKSTVLGTLDCIIDDEIYDVKSASPWSFENKFVNLETMEKEDLFGYVGQAMGYSLATKKYFGGWIVIDKSDGRIKVVPVPKDNYKELARKYLDDFKNKVKTIFFTPNAVLPPCEGVEEESFNRKKTGNLILKKSCEFCPYKYRCHPNLQVRECQNSQAQNKRFKHYIKIEEPNVSEIEN